MAQKLSSELKDRISAIKSRKTAQMTKLKNSKINFNTKMIECINTVMVGDEYKKDPSYLKYERRHSGASKEEWLNSLALEEKIDLLAEYSIDKEINGVNEYEKDLKKAQKIKDATKEDIKIEAKSIRDDLKALITQHDEEMKDLSDKIDKKEADIKDLTIELANINKETKNNKGGKTVDTTESAKTIKDRIDVINEELNGNPDGLKERLKTLQENTIIYKSEIKKAIAELEQAFREEDIEIDEEVENATQTQDNSQPQSANNIETQAPNTNVQDNTDMYAGKESEVARKMMTDFKNLKTERKKYAIEYGAYEDIFNMTRNLSSIRDHRSLNYIRNTMINRIRLSGGKMDLTGVLYNEKGELVDIDGNRINNRGEILDGHGWPISDGHGGNKKGNLSIEQKDLLKLGAKKQDKYLDSVEKQIMYYTENYNDMSVAEKRYANEQMKILKMAIIAIEAKRGKIGRAIEDSSADGLRITELGQMLIDFSNSHATRTIAAEDKSNKLRKMLHVNTKAKKSNVINGLDASKKNIFQRKTNRGEER